MSIATAISALQSASADIADAIEAKGVTVPSGSGFDDYAGLISSISAGGGPSDFLTYVGHYQVTVDTDQSAATVNVFYNTYIAQYAGTGRFIKAIISNNTATGKFGRYAIIINNIGNSILGVRGTETAYSINTISTSFAFYMSEGSVIDIYVYDANFFALATDGSAGPLGFTHVGTYQATEETDLSTTGTSNYFYNTYIAPYAGAGKFIKAVVSNNTATSNNVKAVLAFENFGSNILALRGSDTAYVSRARNNNVALNLSQGSVITTYVYETDFFSI